MPAILRYQLREHSFFEPSTWSVFVGLLGGIANFLFGKDPDIFDERGRVRHQFPESKWKSWDERLKADPKYDWRDHAGKEYVKNPKSKPETK